ncbi:hypothetical protein V8G56_11055 [Gaetbulibacter aquiaggeris]|uniref:Uncharacterized protein n=1 Tax=Gaetbulibacter aquiaggeris TaxID=1735373 RepID=A0ABW7MU97_9FLAO
MKKQELKFLQQDKKSIIVGSIIATIIAMTPYLFYLYESVPDVKVWHTFLFSYNSGFYESAYTSMWVLTSKGIPLLLLIIWFFTCRHWWYHALLVPITMYAYQMFITIKADAEFMDTNQLIFLIPIMIVIIPSIYLIRARIFNEVHTANQTMQELEDELKISPKGFWDKIKQYF